MWRNCEPKKRLGGGAAATPPNQNLKNTDFVNMISEVLHYILSSRNKLLKSGDKYSTLEFWKMILKTWDILDEIKKKTRRFDLLI
jgi:hypothetical protein